MADGTLRRFNTESEACARSDESLVRAFDLLGRRWTGVILGTLSGGSATFGTLARAVDGISDSMLSARLGALTTAGLVSRNVREGPPLSVAYELTDPGRALLPALEQISRWAKEHLPPAERSDQARRGSARGGRVSASEPEL